MSYIAYVRYGTSKKGYDEYLGLSSDEESFVLVNNTLEPAAIFDTLVEAREAVHQWCEKARLELVRSGLHSGKAWNQTREGTWKYQEVEDTEISTSLKDLGITTIYYF